MGGRGGGSGGGIGGGGDSVVNIISRAGGVLGGEFLDEGFKDFKWTSKAFAGTTPAQATAIATGKADVRESLSISNKRLPAITVDVDTLKNGKTVVSLRDGRHRSISAALAGATHIRAEVHQHRQLKNGEWTYPKPVTRIVKLGKPRTESVASAKREGKLP